MRKLLLVLLILVAVVALYGTGDVDKSKSSAPPGVAASDWIPLGDSYGFVIVRTLRIAQAAPPAQPPKQLPNGSYLGIVPVDVIGDLSGYFMVKRQDGWYKLSEEKEVKVLPLK